jgi:hypothetical protein
LALDTAWQIGSKTPPMVCLCCGQPFDNAERKKRGPYLTMPYIWVCEWCWKQPHLFFPDHPAQTLNVD